MKNDRQIRRDSEEAGLQAHRDAVRDIEPPEGVTLCSQEEVDLWNQYTHARSLDAWREFDLILISKMVKLEVKIRAGQALIETEGHIIENSKGDPILNPRVKAVDIIERQHISLITKLSMGISSEKGQDSNKTGTKKVSKDRIDSIKGDNKKGTNQISLLAH